MSLEIYFLALFLSLISTFLIIPWLIPRLKNRGIIGLDRNKSPETEIPEMGSIAIVFGFFIGVYFQIIANFMFELDYEMSQFLIATLLTVLGIAFIGLLDDLMGISQRTKAFLPFFFSLHLGVFAPSVLYVPIIGQIDFGFFMLFLVPFGITCATNSTNMLEGFNGLSAGLCIIISTTLIIISIMNQVFESLFLLFPLLGALLSFLYYNYYPAKIFPGDTMTLFVGGTIGCAAIISNLKLEGTILFIPMIIEFLLKAKGNFKAQSFATSSNGEILIYSGKIESLTHLVMSKVEVNEKRLVHIFWLFELLLSILVIYLSYTSVL